MQVGVVKRAGCHSNPNEENDQRCHQEAGASSPCVAATHRRHLTTMRTAGQGVVQRVKQKRIAAIAARDTTHSRHRGRSGAHARTTLSTGALGARQDDDSFAVGTRTGDSLTAGATYQQTVARASHVLFTGRGRTNRRRLLALVALDHVRFAGVAYVEHFAAHATRNDG